MDWHLRSFYARGLDALEGQGDKDAAATVACMHCTDDSRIRLLDANLVTPGLNCQTVQAGPAYRQFWTIVDRCTKMDLWPAWDGIAGLHVTQDHHKAALGQRVVSKTWCRGIPW
jgi:hypothetical protein